MIPPHNRNRQGQFPMRIIPDTRTARSSFFGGVTLVFSASGFTLLRSERFSFSSRLWSFSFCLLSRTDGKGIRLLSFPDEFDHVLVGLCSCVDSRLRPFNRQREGLADDEPIEESLPDQRLPERECWTLD